MKTRFLITAEATKDGKTTVRRIKTIQLVGEDRVYEFLPELQDKDLHKKLFTLPVIKDAGNSLKARAWRNVAVTLPEEIKKLYFDEDNNARFIFTQRRTNGI